MVTLAFLVHNKVEDEAIRFINSIKPLLVSVKVLITKTEKNKIENVLDRKNLSLQPSLEFKGDATIMSKVSRGEVDAVFLFVPPSEITLLSDFLNACNKSKRVYISLNSITGDCIMQRLAIEKKLLPVSGGTISKATALKKVGVQSSVQELVVAPYPFNVIQPKSMTPQQERRQEWSEQQLSFWLSENKLEYLEDVFKDRATEEPEARLWVRHEALNNYLKVKGGTVEQLVDLLVVSEASPLGSIFEHAVFIRDWFLTYQSFMGSKEFLEVLKVKYRLIREESEDREEEEESLRSFINILSIWISFDPYEFREGGLHDGLLEFIKGSIAEYQSMEANSLMVLLEKKMVEVRDGGGRRAFVTRRSMEPAPIPVLPKRKENYSTINSVMEVDPVELGRQITMMESEIFQSVRPKEFHKAHWTKKNAMELAPNLIRIIQQNNHISNWMITELLLQKKNDDIVGLLVKFIKLGRFLFSINNFSATMAVVTALSNSAVNKLKSAWAMVPQKYMEIFKGLSDLVSPLGHYKNYRDHFRMRDQSMPCLPVFVATLSDLNGYEEVFADFKGDFVNWAKMNKVGECIWDIMSVYTDYNYQSVPMIQQYIMEHQVWVDNLTACAIADLRMQEMMKQSEIKEKDRKISRRRTSTIPFSVGDMEMGPVDDLSESEWNHILMGATLSELYTKDTVILPAGAINQHLFRIKKGRVRVVKEVRNSTGSLIGEEILTYLNEGQMFGEVSMLLSLQKEGTTASIVADSDVVLWVLNMDYVYGLWEQSPVLAERLNKILAIKMARRLREMGSKKSPRLTSSTQQPTIQSSGNGGTKGSESLEELRGENKSKKVQISLNKFKKRFGLKNEIPIMEFLCSLKDAITVHGTLYLTQNYLCFYGTVFGSKQADIIPLSNITSLRVKKRYLVIKYSNEVEQSELIFTHFENLDEAFPLIYSIWNHRQKMGGSDEGAMVLVSSKSANLEGGSGKSQSEITAGRNENGTKTILESMNMRRMSWEPNGDDWNLILKGARVVTYNVEDVVIREGEKINRLYQLQRGECRFEKLINDQVEVLGKLVKDTDSLFGEISYLEGGNASASVVCNRNGTEVAIIEGYWLDVLFQYYPELSGRWYHYLARVLSKRLKQRESLNDESNYSRSPLGSEESDAETERGKGHHRSNKISSSIHKHKKKSTKRSSGTITMNKNA